MRTNENTGLIVFGLGILIVAFIVFLAIASITPSHASFNQPAYSNPHPSHRVQVYHMTDGSAAYHGADGFWYWYLLSPSSSSTTYVPTRPGTWSQRTYGPGGGSTTTNVKSIEKETPEELEEETSAELPTQPEVESEAAESETDSSSAEASPSTETEAPAAEAAPESTDSGSSGGDSGGGDGGGSSD